MAPVLGAPPPPPPAPHMGPDGLILPRKPYNPCLISTNHKDLHRELLFNQKIGKNVLNQKSELQRALEKHREAASRREAERIREESYKDDPRTALQRAIEQRARNIQLTQEQSQATMEPPSNLLITARAKLRPRTESQWAQRRSEIAPRMNKTIDRSRFARVAHRVISYLGALSIAINMYIRVTSDKISLARELLRRLSFGTSEGVL